jgi:hypothetical protein
MHKSTVGHKRGYLFTFDAIGKSSIPLCFMAQEAEIMRSFLGELIN